MSKTQTRPKIDQLWDLVFALADDEETSGKINFNEDDTQDGGVSVTLDGVRYYVDIYPKQRGDEGD